MRKPDLLLFYAGPGWGKTSLFSHLSNPLWLKCKDEGIETLIQNNQVRDNIDRITVDSWIDAMGILKNLAASSVAYTHVVLDVLNGLEWHCHQYTTQVDFEGKFVDGFMAFHKGYETALQYWAELFPLFDKLRDKGIGIVGLCHAGIGKVPNPEGIPYTKNAPDMNDKTWGFTQKQTDLILYGRYKVKTMDQLTIGKKAPSKTKAVGGNEREIVTVSSASIDAKHRHGLPNVIDISNNSPTEAWTDFINAFQSKE